jgi:SAM-dependent methyltransferase
MTTRSLRKAESFGSRIAQGDLLKDPDLLGEVLAFLKNTRRIVLEAQGENGPDPDLERAYVQLAGTVHAAIGSALSQAFSAPFSPLTTGRANIYTGISEAGGARWFFKITRSAHTNEQRFFDALFRKRIPAAGAGYAFHSPLTVMEFPGFRVYVFPAIETPGLTFELRKSPELVRKVIRAIAEFNLSLGPLSHATCPEFLARQTFPLPADYADRVAAAFSERAAASGIEIQGGALKIAADWDCITGFAQKTVWGVSHGDLAPANVTLADDRILFLDLGAAGFAPLGSDLYWLLYKNRRDREAQDEIIAEYREALRAHGTELSAREITINAFSKYCWKWLIPNRLGTRADFDHFVRCQGTALELIDTIREHSSAPQAKAKRAGREPEYLGGVRLPSGKITAGTRPKRTLRLKNALLARAFDLTGKRVLDLGCAEGLHSLYMSESAAEVVGVDHRGSKIALAAATAQALGISNVSFRRGDVRDQDFLRELGRFDLVLAWGLLHRVSDVFSLLYTLERLSGAWSLEWRTPVLPFMSSLSLAYHAPVGDALDPMNVPGRGGDGSELGAATERKKIEGATGFWDPTPGAVTAIARRLGYGHATVLGYDDPFVSETAIVEQSWTRHLKKLKSGKRSLYELPSTRVHMIFEKSRDSIRIRDLSGGEVRLPEWDLAIQEAERAAIEKKDRSASVKRAGF